MRGRADRPEERAVTFFLERFDRVFGEGGAGLLEGFVAGAEGDECEFEVGGWGEGFEDASACLAGGVSVSFV